MLALRSLQKSHDHDLRIYWRFRARQVRTRLSGRQPQYRPTAPLKRVASLDVKRSRSARTLLLDLPELGTLSRQQLAALVGVAPLIVIAAPSGAAGRSGDAPLRLLCT